MVREDALWSQDWVEDMTEEQKAIVLQVRNAIID